MSIEARITAAKELIRKREEIDQQLADLFSGATPKKPKCSVCGSTEHTARTCPQKSAPGTQPQLQSPLPSSPFASLSRHTTNDDRDADL
ncbi:hypothetical protein [Methylocystis hirsuta]|uniref:CCHC-type domain-containing protein n=1 Tax=Methylocystis hirsuta TaxID=369798 RepID=A0A3M9XSX9_9HYPH|nr:hypothetical protein [Methylocystis hirsuta]RNJ51363.1 hypothetical protein D1O30_18955 [Methylocystis hirsuta]